MRSDECRFCCKSPKLRGDNFPAIRRSNRRAPIFVASAALARSLTSLSSGHEVPPHLYTKVASIARRIFDQQCKKSFATKSDLSHLIFFLCCGACACAVEREEDFPH